MTKVKFLEGSNRPSNTISIVAWQQGQKLVRVQEFLKEGEFELSEVLVRGNNIEFILKQSK